MSRTRVKKSALHFASTGSFGVRPLPEIARMMRGAGVCVDEVFALCRAEISAICRQEQRAGLHSLPKHHAHNRPPGRLA